MAEGGDQGGQAPARRAFLRLAAAAGGASLLSACSGKGSAPAASGSTATASLDSGPPTSADWTALARDLSGTLVRPGESGYTTAEELFDPRFDSLRPAGIAYCRNPHD